MNQSHYQAKSPAESRHHQYFGHESIKGKAQIEELSYQNLEAITDLATELWPDSKRNDELEFFFNAVKKMSLTAFLMKEGRKYIGFVMVGLRMDHVEGTSTSPVCYIEGIYVREKFRRTGIARELIERAGSWGRSKGCTEIASDTEIDNARSIDFHKAIGFKEANRVVCLSKKL